MLSVGDMIHGAEIITVRPVKTPLGHPYVKTQLATTADGKFWYICTHEGCSFFAEKPQSVVHSHWRKEHAVASLDMPGVSPLDMKLGEILAELGVLRQENLKLAADNESLRAEKGAATKELKELKKSLGVLAKVWPGAGKDGA